LRADEERESACRMLGRDTWLAGEKQRESRSLPRHSCEVEAAAVGMSQFRDEAWEMDFWRVLLKLVFDSITRLMGGWRDRS
jgi:hypothetical protein